MSDAEIRIARLEERLAWYERHATEQDRAMMELADEVGRLRVDVKSLRERAASTGAGRGGEEMPAEEKPPHY